MVSSFELWGTFCIKFGFGESLESRGFVKTREFFKNLFKEAKVEKVTFVKKNERKVDFDSISLAISF